MDIDFFTDTTAWVIAIVLFLVFMSLIWMFPDVFGGTWEGKEGTRIAITILALPTCYVIAKWRLG